MPARAARFTFLWTRAAGSQVNGVPGLAATNNKHIPEDLSANGTVVGRLWFPLSGGVFPFRVGPAHPFQQLPSPGPTWIGAARTVSADGSIAAGYLQDGPTGVPQAVLWGNDAVTYLGTTTYSDAHDLSADGRVSVGESGTTAATARATRWVDGVETGLAAVAGQSGSTARLVSEDGDVAFGWADVGGQNLLVRWSGSQAQVLTPPAGLSVTVLNATNATGSAVVGALDTLPLLPGSFANDQVPFLWSVPNGFVLLGELGLAPDYDLAEAVDVSDDGARVVGTLNATVISNGFPPATAFLWTALRGTRPLDDLLVEGGFDARGLFAATAISGDGRRIVASGLESPPGATSVLLELTGEAPLPFRAIDRRPTSRRPRSR